MHKISTTYRFYTPFLDVNSEKDNLLSVIKKIEKSLIFDWIDFNKLEKKWNKYYKITLEFFSMWWKIDIFFINSLEKDEYFLPIFKIDIYLELEIFLLNNYTRKKTVNLLNNIFECFDWLDEKEYLIDLDDSIFYSSWLFNSKKYPNHDFLDLEQIRKNFENENWVKVLEDFIKSIQSWNYVLTKENTKTYFKFYWVLLYFIYLLYIMHLNIQKTSETLTELEKLWDDTQNDIHIQLMKQRLSYVDDLTIVTYENYKEKLELFFNLLD